VSRGIGQAALDTDVPIIFGVLTTDTVAQAEERAHPEKLNRGGAAARAAIEMVRVMQMISGDVETLESGTSTNQSGRMQERRKR
jgi:6,7-dimethyl-8-ribityllumazine synthase